MKYSKAMLEKQLEAMGLKRSDTVLVHSSMKAIGDVDGGAETVLDALMSYFSDGLVLMPSHTWAFMKEDGQIFDSKNSESCVGILTNLFFKNRLNNV